MIDQPKLNRALINNDQYFSEAWNWYCNKYLKQNTERVWLIALSILCTLILTLHIFALQTFFPLAPEIPFAIHVDGNDDDIHVIKKLSSDTKNPQIALASYLAAHYVKLREEYNYYNLEEQKEYIKANSSRLIYKKFLNHLDTNLNPNSPLLVYKKNGTRTVQVTDVKLYGNSNNNATVKIITHDNLTNIAKQQNVLLKFTLSSIIPTVLKLVPLEFRVITYGK